MRTRVPCSLLLLLFASSCFNTKSASTGDPYYDLRSEDITVLMNATIAVSGERNFGAVPYLIQNLRHSDTWVRGFTVFALMEIRGVTDDKLGFEYTGSEAGREEGIARWEKWYQEEQARRAMKATTLPAP